MNYGPVIFLGLLFTVWFSWYGFIFKNYRDLGRQAPAKLDTGDMYPVGRPGLARSGQEIYQQNGCAACHTMQVRMKGYGADIDRGFGARNTVLQAFEQLVEVLEAEMREEVPGRLVQDGPADDLLASGGGDQLPVQERLDDAAGLDVSEKNLSVSAQ
mgnify:CR=1 FL=1